MDLRLLLARPTDAERAAVDAVVGAAAEPAHLEPGWGNGATPVSPNGQATVIDIAGQVARTGHAARSRRHLLLPALQAVQARVGWISDGALGYICEQLMVPPADAYGVATFYGLLSLDPRPARVVHVCDDIACRCAGAEELIAALEAQVGPEGAGGDACWLRSPCLGQCDRAPAAFLTHAGPHPAESVLAPLTTDAALAVLRGADTPRVSPSTIPQRGDAELVLLRRVDVVEPHSLHDYRARGGYDALRRAFELGPAGVLREIKEARLMGRGGAAFPTAVKWEAVAQQPAQPHYLICNADESEPGTFKDRVVMEGDPFSLIEAMTLAAYATDCRRGFIYLRGEYPAALQALSGALDAAHRHGYLGPNILGHGFGFEIEIRRGAGAYICGEETAIFNSIEGFRGEPRSKPPFPVVHGLFGKPTVINNVETLINVLPIVLGGGRTYAAIGTEGSTGPRLFCLSGHVTRPGVYEVPFGETLGGLLARAGGVSGTGRLQAVLLGGAAGSFVRPDQLELPLTFEDARAVGTTLGSGVVMAFDSSVDLPAILMRIAGFFRDESCGQCTPCRVGTVRQEEALARLLSGRTRGKVADELALISDVGTCMRDASICGLGQTAFSAIGSAINTLGVFSEEVA